MFDEPTQTTLPPFVEVELVYETGTAGMGDAPWGAFVVWTQNRVYHCDQTMRCIEVIHRESERPDREHPLIGARLSGGQVKQDDAIEITYPCPRPGCEAVFERPGVKGYVTTSTVTRVVLRLRVLTVPLQRAAPTWDDLTASGRRPAAPKTPR
ncbi:MAG: hypothetical protein AAGH15_13115 [Myxococcota bacterium]